MPNDQENSDLRIDNLAGPAPQADEGIGALWTRRQKAWKDVKSATGWVETLRGNGTVRYPLAHEPKILWQGEDDAADYFSLISLLHRKLDDAVPTRPKGTIT